MTEEADEPWRLKLGERARCDEPGMKRLIARQAEFTQVEGGVMSTPDELRAAGRPAGEITDVERQWRSLTADMRVARLCAAVEQGIDRS